jgi:hypothetical protein
MTVKVVKYSHIFSQFAKIGRFPKEPMFAKNCQDMRGCTSVIEDCKVSQG